MAMQGLLKSDAASCGRVAFLGLIRGNFKKSNIFVVHYRILKDSSAHSRKGFQPCLLRELLVPA